MADYSEYQTGTAPPWLLNPNGEGLLLVEGHIKSAIQTGAKEAVKARYPTYAATDALEAIGADRNLEPGRGESYDSFRAWVLSAWDNWHLGGTESGMLQILHRAGLPNITIYEWRDWQYGAAADNWAKFYIIVEQPFPWNTDGIWDDPGEWSDGGVWNTDASLDDVTYLKRQIFNWKPAHAKCAAVLFIVSGSLWAEVDGSLENVPIGWPGVFFYLRF